MVNSYKYLYVLDDWGIDTCPCVSDYYKYIKKERQSAENIKPVSLEEFRYLLKKIIILRGDRQCSCSISLNPIDVLESLESENDDVQ